MIYIMPTICDKYLETRGYAIAETWASTASSHGCQVVLAGDEDKTHSFGLRQINGLVPEGANPKRTSNAYDDGTVKLFNSIRWASQQEDLTWAFFCDDDTYVKVDRLKKYTTTLNPRFICCFAKDMKGEWPGDRRLPYPSGGAGFLMSKATIDTVVQHLDRHLKTTPYYGDVMFGDVLRRLSIDIIDHGVFYELSESEEWKEWQWSGKKRASAITYHYMTPARMRSLHKVLTTEKKEYWREIDESL